MMYSHIVFDADGTLIDSENAYLVSLRDAIFDLNKKDMALEDLRFSFGLTNKDVWNRLGVEYIEQADALWQKYYFKYSGSVRIFDGIREMLRDLAGLPRVLGLVTSKPKIEYVNDVVPHGVSDFFDYIILAEDTQEHKPHPGPMLKFLECSEADPKTTLYVGDTLSDMLCAKGAGVDFALALWGGSRQSTIVADYYLKHPRKVVRLA